MIHSMKAVVELIAAPKRGQYDRALSRNERQAAQQERVIAAVVAVAAAGRELSVASVVEHAGIGRNTFYEYFDDVEHALMSINGRARRELIARAEPALRLARTPLERVRALARAWAESVSANPALTRLALRAQSAEKDPAELSVLGRYVVSVLEGDVESRSTLPGLVDALRVTAVAAVFDAVSRAHLEKQSSPGDLQRILADFALRLLR
jgi:AcrR family transcriptional regulator